MSAMPSPKRTCWGACSLRVKRNCGAGKKETASHVHGHAPQAAGMCSSIMYTGAPPRIGDGSNQAMSSKQLCGRVLLAACLQCPMNRNLIKKQIAWAAQEDGAISMRRMTGMLMAPSP